MASARRRASLLTALALGTVGLGIGLAAPLWAFHTSFPGDPSSARTFLFDIGPPGAYFQSYVIGVGHPPPPQATLDLDVVLWADVTFGIVAGAVAVARSALAVRRDLVPALTHGATVAALGLAAVAGGLLFVEGPTAYAPGTNCPSCTAYAGGSGTIAWSWSPGVGTIGVVLAVTAFALAVGLESTRPRGPGIRAAQLGSLGIVAGIALFSVVIGTDFQAWYPFGPPYLLLWALIVAVPVASAALGLRGVRRAVRASRATA